MEVAVGAVVESDDHLLLIVRGQAPGQGKWSLPGGRVRPGESMSAAVEREVLEETGLAVVCGDFVGWVERLSPTHHFLIMDFRASVEADTPPPVAADDADEAKWVPKGDVLALDLVDGLGEFLLQHRVL